MIAHVISYHVCKKICIKTKKDANVLSNHVPYLRYDDGDEIIPYAIIPIRTSRPMIIAHTISNQNSASSNSLSHESSALRTETKKICNEYPKRSVARSVCNIDRVGHVYICIYMYPCENLDMYL